MLLAHLEPIESITNPGEVLVRFFKVLLLLKDPLIALFGFEELIVLVIDVPLPQLKFVPMAYFGLERHVLLNNMLSRGLLEVQLEHVAYVEQVKGIPPRLELFPCLAEPLEGSLRIEKSPVFDISDTFELVGIQAVLASDQVFYQF